MTVDFKYYSSPIKLENEQLPPLVLPSRSSQPEFNIQAKVAPEINVYESFFRTTQHPIIIVDLNPNTQKASPNLFNPSANSLRGFLESDMFNESYLENFNGTLSEFLCASRRKVQGKIMHTDILHLLVKIGTERSEAVFSFSAVSFELGAETRMLGILLMEITKTIKEELDALDIFRSSLISALSHELNNPMNSLMLLLKMMPSSYGENKNEDLKEMALTSAKILQNKIRDLIDYAMIEMDKIKLTQTEFFVDDLFEELKQTFKHEVSMKFNELITKVNNNNNRLVILGDRNRIEQVLVKLISNANKFTNGGKIILSATEGKNNFNVIFSVRDTGTGIPEEKKELLFESLKQKAKHSSAKLSGLGLAIARSICKCMDSTLKFTSEKGLGTKFSFEIPLCQIATFSKPLAGIELLFDKNNFPLYPIANRISKGSNLNGAIEENKKSVKDPSILNEETNEVKKEKEVLLSSELSKSTKFKKDTSRIFGKIKLTSMLSFTFPKLRNPEADALEENINVHKIIPTYNGSMKNERNKNECYTNKKKKSIVLIVDDVYSNRMVIRELMNKMQVSTSEADNGKCAVNFVEKSFQKDSNTNIALILMDLNMPVMTGIEASVAIRKLERTYKRTKTIPIIAVTAHSAMYGKDECIKAGMQDCAAKPVTNNTLKLIVEHYAPKLIGISSDQNVLRK